MLSEPYNWKFNQVIADQWLTRQDLNIQDYQSSLSDIGWLESATYTDLISTQQPQPIDILETVRELQPSSIVGIPEKVSYFQEVTLA